MGSFWKKASIFNRKCKNYEITIIDFLKENTYSTPLELKKILGKSAGALEHYINILTGFGILVEKKVPCEKNEKHYYFLNKTFNKSVYEKIKKLSRKIDEDPSSSKKIEEEISKLEDRILNGRVKQNYEEIAEYLPIFQNEKRMEIIDYLIENEGAELKEILDSFENYKEFTIRYNLRVLEKTKLIKKENGKYYLGENFNKNLFEKIKDVQNSRKRWESKSRNSRDTTL